VAGCGFVVTVESPPLPTPVAEDEEVRLLDEPDAVVAEAVVEVLVEVVEVVTLTVVLEPPAELAVKALPRSGA
jgi:hypothetical protein